MCIQIKRRSLVGTWDVYNYSKFPSELCLRSPRTFLSNVYLFIYRTREAAQPSRNARHPAGSHAQFLVLPRQSKPDTVSIEITCRTPKPTMRGAHLGKSSLSASGRLLLAAHLLHTRAPAHPIQPESLHLRGSSATATRIERCSGWVYPLSAGCNHYLPPVPRNPGPWSAWPIRNGESRQYAVGNPYMAHPGPAAAKSRIAGSREGLATPIGVCDGSAMLDKDMR